MCCKHGHSRHSKATCSLGTYLPKTETPPAQCYLNLFRLHRHHAIIIITAMYHIIYRYAWMTGQQPRRTHWHLLLRLLLRPAACRSAPPPHCCTHHATACMPAYLRKTRLISRRAAREQRPASRTYLRGCVQWLWTTAAGRASPACRWKEVEGQCHIHFSSASSRSSSCICWWWWASQLRVCVGGRALKAPTTPRHTTHAPTCMTSGAPRHRSPISGTWLGAAAPPPHRQVMTPPPRPPSRTRAAPRSRRSPPRTHT